MVTEASIRFEDGIELLERKVYERVDAAKVSRTKAENSAVLKGAADLFELVQIFDFCSLSSDGFSAFLANWSAVSAQFGEVLEAIKNVFYLRR